VPLAAMFGYSTDIRTLSSGRASYAMEPSHFETVPAKIVAELVEQRGGGYVASPPPVRDLEPV
jgi:elongation factor G